MVKKVEFKKKPLKSEETEQKLDQWLETKIQPPAEPAKEKQATPATEQAVEPTAQAEKAPQKPKKADVSFDKQEEEIEIAQVTFHMPKSLQRRLKFECFRQDKTIKDFVIELLDKKLPKDADAR